MTPHQEAHLASIKSQFLELVDPKFRAGAAEHGGDLMDMSEDDLIDNCILEAVDQLVYLMSLKMKRSTARVAPDQHY